MQGYSKVFDFDSDFYKKHSNVMKMENASTTGVENKISTETGYETEECDSSD